MRSSYRLHERQSFFKYMSTSTAAVVLRSRTLRWSSPVLFNDPFDVPRELSFGVTPEQIVSALADSFSSLIDNPPDDTSVFEPKVRLILEAVKRGITPELKKELLAGIREVAAGQRPTSHSLDALRQLWRSWLPDYRILCLTESPAHMAMWYHYADHYCGAALEFQCIDEIDSAWLAAKPVSYPAEKPFVYTAEGWAQLLNMPHDIAVRTIIHTATYTKSPDWSYEAEWRVVSSKRPTDTGDYTDYKFDPRELGAVYLGPMMSSSDRQALLEAATAYPGVKVRNVTIGMSRELEFRDEAT
jgi:hypothetical protein